MFPWKSYVADIALTFQKHKDYAEKAFHQVPADEAFFKKPAPDSNSIALIVKHLAGNLKSRFSDFLTSDGDKPWRDRDGEFVIRDGDTRAALLRAWEEGWKALFLALDALTENDLTKSVTIRQEAHTVFQALHRALAHTAYHVGQVTYLARMLTADRSQWITIPPGQSTKVGPGKYLKP